MKKLVYCLTPALLAVPLFLHAQSTTYFSNVGFSSSFQHSIASDSWAASYFTTGSAAAGYSLQSIQLLLGSSSGSPTGLSVRLWDFLKDQPILTLSGPDPTSAGFYTYTASDFVMPPGHVYWFVVTSQTPAAAGAFHLVMHKPMIVSRWSHRQLARRGLLCFERRSELDANSAVTSSFPVFSQRDLDPRAVSPIVARAGCAHSRGA